jgi:hypothetical protein
MALPRANLKRALAWRDAERLPWVPHERVWGPVSAADAIAVGCVRAAASVVIRPKLSPHALAAAVRCVPTEVLPRADDTPATLAARLALTPWLDDAHVLNAGNGRRGKHGKKRRRLNETTYQQPRRKSWSVTVLPQRPDEDGEQVVSLCNYSAYGREAKDVRCEPMPMPVFTLGEQVWLAAMPYLCEESRRNPPTHCQLLLYYRLFRSAMGRHRDNYTVRHLRAMLEGGEAVEAGSTHASMENSQRMGSEVLLYTEGTDPMDFTLSFPPSDNLGTDIRNYVRSGVFTVSLGHGTLMVFKAIDDEFFCHEAAFDVPTWQHLRDPTGYRMCYVFRWCTSVKNFRVAPACSFKSDVAPPMNVLDV